LTVVEITEVDISKLNKYTLRIFGALAKSILWKSSCLQKIKFTIKFLTKIYFTSST